MGLNMGRKLRRYSIIEWAIAALIILIVARLIWAPEIKAFEARLVVSWGMPLALRYVLVTLLAILGTYQLYLRGIQHAARTGMPLVRKSVVFGSLAILALAIGLLFLLRSSTT